ncbi:MAG: hypothetical protein J3K34DRAFT_422275, partial [Monoraphidium minutum]
RRRRRRAGGDELVYWRVCRRTHRRFRERPRGRRRRRRRRAVDEPHRRARRQPAGAERRGVRVPGGAELPRQRPVLQRRPDVRTGVLHQRADVLLWGLLLRRTAVRQQVLPRGRALPRRRVLQLCADLREHVLPLWHHVHCGQLLPRRQHVRAHQLHGLLHLRHLVRTHHRPVLPARRADAQRRLLRPRTRLRRRQLLLRRSDMRQRPVLRRRPALQRDLLPRGQLVPGRGVRHFGVNPVRRRGLPAGHPLHQRPVLHRCGVPGHLLRGRAVLQLWPLLPQRRRVCVRRQLLPCRHGVRPRQPGLLPSRRRPASRRLLPAGPGRLRQHLLLFRDAVHCGHVLPLWHGLRQHVLPDARRLLQRLPMLPGPAAARGRLLPRRQHSLR